MLTTIIQQLVAMILEFPSTDRIQDISFDIPTNPVDIFQINSISDRNLPKPNPRRGCAIGWDASNSLSDSPLSPTTSKTLPLDVNDLGSHIYGGPKSIVPFSDDYISLDKIGHIYTKFGGIIDLGHLRDHADIVRYAATKVLDCLNNGGEFSLGDDTDPCRDNTGERIIKIKAIGGVPSAYQAAVIGARISYDTAVWHEISTYKTMQDYSTFSPEDNYSNLLGAYIGFKACLMENISFNEAVTSLIIETLNKLSPVSKRLTNSIVSFLDEKWFSYRNVPEDPYKPLVKATPVYFPDIFLELNRRHCNTGYNQNIDEGLFPSNIVSPWLVTDTNQILPEEIRRDLIEIIVSSQRVSIKIPTGDENGLGLSFFYSYTVQNAANKDQSLLIKFVDNTNSIESNSFGSIAELVRKKYIAEFGDNVDKPNIT